MIRLRLDQLADVVAGDLADPGDADRVVDAVVIDSRDAGPGALFVPLTGEHVDGHDFVADAVSRGAAAHLIASERPLSGGPGAIVVDDPADALLGLGAWVRDAVDPRTVAITGSQGKTTTKDLIAVAAAAAPEGGRGLRVVAAPGSFNNELGVPLTCCLLEEDSDVLVTELGSRGLGHIARLAPIVRPDIAVVTAVGASHLELLGDIDTVGRAKAELVESLGPSGVAVLNADDARVAAMAGIAPSSVTYGVEQDADWRATDIRFDALARPVFTATGPEGRAVEVRLAILGSHNVSNALAALAVADQLGVDAAAAAAALGSARVSRWRMELVETAGGIVVLNDAYNANPASMDAALRTLGRMEVPGRRWAVLGQMAELGVTGPVSHDLVGRTAAEVGLDGLVVVGETARGIASGAAALAGACTETASAEEALTVLAERLRPGDAVLVKASRSVGLERLAAALVEHFGGATGGEPGSEVPTPGGGGA